MERQSLGLGLRAEHVDDLIQEILNVDLVGIDLQAPGFDLGDIEETVDKTGEMLGAAADDLDRRLSWSGNGFVALENLRVAEARRSAACAIRD